MMRQGSGGNVQNFKSIRQKTKNFILGSFFFWGGALGAGDWTAVNIKSWTDPRNGLKNPNMNFGNDRSHRLGGV